MLEQLDGKVAVITGAGSGIEAALARACAAEAMNVVGRRGSGPSRICCRVHRRDGIRRAPSRVDVADPASVERLAGLVYDTFGATHLLCNNAGVCSSRIWRSTWRR